MAVTYKKPNTVQTGATTSVSLSIYGNAPMRTAQIYS
jgi:hypothetical protein